MGQQQLLLLVLAIVIVAIAVVAGIVAFKERSRVAQRDEAVAEAMQIVTAAQVWRSKPAAMGGAIGSVANDFSGVNLKAIGFPVKSADTSEPLINLHGCYKLAPISEGAEVNVYLNSVDGDCDAASHIARIRITGTTSHDITWTH